MAIVQMQKLSIAASKKNRKAILELLQSMGVMEIHTDSLTDPDLRKMDTQTARMKYDRRADSFDRVLALLDTYAPEKKSMLDSFNGPEEVGRSRLDRVIKERRSLNQDAATILKFEKQISDLKGVIQKNENQIEWLIPWQELDVPMTSEGTKETALLLGSLPGELTAPDVYAAAAEGLPEPACVTADVISTGNEATLVSVLTLKKDREKVEENLRRHGFARPQQIVRGVPREVIEDLKKENEHEQKHIEALEKKIAEFAPKREDYMVAGDYYRSRSAKYSLLGTIPQSENAFFLEGYVPADQAGAVKTLLGEKFGAVVETEEIAEDEQVPTLLKNNRFSASVEGVLESYGLPTRGHVDPTFVMSIFYVFFFGMMLSDAGYGILMFLACGFLLKKYPNMGSGMKKMMQMFFWCGISTAFWGFMFGGVFGDLADVIAKTWFGYPADGPAIIPALWFVPLNNPMRLLLWCMLFGVIHLFAGLLIKGYEYLKDGDVVGFVSDVLSWLMFLMGLILILLPTDLFEGIAQMEFNFPPFVGTLAKILTFAGLALILVMAERSTKNWVLRILLGAYDVYGVTSWLSDVLSYSRLLALGLATGVIASVVNMMAGMVAQGKGIIGVILFIVICLAGHTLNFAINVLGAYVHTNRLQFVEFFGKFYEAGGEPFQPFTTANKYVEIKEERN